MKEAAPVGKGREHPGGRQTQRGLRPFHRGIKKKIHEACKFLSNIKNNDYLKRKKQFLHQ